MSQPPPPNPGETARLLALFLLGVSVGICLTLMYLDIFRTWF